MTYSAHFTLQGKGGCGKSLIASCIAQYHVSLGLPLRGVDTDPTNATFAGYRGLPVDRLELLEPGGSVIIERRFDDLVEAIAVGACNFVVDNGATSFLPLTSYMLENDVFGVLKNSDVRPVIHTVITGGQAMNDTLNGFDALAKQLPAGVDLVVWLNGYFGDIQLKGKPFEKSDLYKQHQARIYGLVSIPRQTSSTFGADMAAMLDARMTFDEAQKSEQFGMMAKSRLHRMQEHLFNQLQVVLPRS